MSEAESGVPASTSDDKAPEMEKSACSQGSEETTEQDISECDAKLEFTQGEPQPTKNRRKIRQPKQYKPKVADEDDTLQQVVSVNEEVYNDPPETHRVTDEQQASPASTTSSSPEYVSMLCPESPASPIHVITASCEDPKARNNNNRIGKRPGPKPGKKPGKKSCGGEAATERNGAGRRVKDPQVVVPMRPEDLVWEALSNGESPMKVTKRDAQYRKSYAYKIWKEKADCEVPSEGQNSRDKKNKKRGTSSSKRGATQRRQAAVYWSPNQYPGHGFFANGQYYRMNPPQIIHGVNRGAQGSLAPAVLPVVAIEGQDLAARPKEFPATDQEAVEASTPPVVENGKPKSASDELPEIPIPSSREDTVARQVSRPKSVGTSRSSDTPPFNVHSDPSSSSDTGETAVSTSSTKTMNTGTESSKTPERKPKKTFSSRKSSEDMKHVSSISTSPTNLVTTMKSTLRHKYCKENVEPTLLPKSKHGTKRKVDAGANENDECSPAKKDAKATIFTPLDEHQAAKLANDIYDVNLEYFPFETLAEKAAQNDEEDKKKLPAKVKSGPKVEEIEKVRSLLKDFYDITHSCAEDPDMQKFDSASRKFGRKNILNHLSLLDRYFAELQKRIDSPV